MHKAPRIGEVALITGLAEPPISYPVGEVVGFDADHDAWQVRVTVKRPDMGCMIAPDTTLWVRRSTTLTKLAWRLYDITQPIAVARTRS